MRSSTFDTLALGLVFTVVLAATHASSCEDLLPEEAAQSVAVHVENDTDRAALLYEVDASGRERLVERIHAGGLTAFVTQPSGRWVVRQDGQVLRQFIATEASWQSLELVPNVLAAH
jgi:hypothetical protein